jgi:hypothetical protein
MVVQKKFILTTEITRELEVTKHGYAIKYYSVLCAYSLSFVVK